MRVDDAAQDLQKKSGGRISAEVFQDLIRIIQEERLTVEHASLMLRLILVVVLRAPDSFSLEEAELLRILMKLSVFDVMSGLISLAAEETGKVYALE